MLPCFNRTDARVRCLQKLHTTGGGGARGRVKKIKFEYDTVSKKKTFSIRVDLLMTADKNLSGPELLKVAIQNTAHKYDRKRRYMLGTVRAGRQPFGFDTLTLRNSIRLCKEFGGPLVTPKNMSKAKQKSFKLTGLNRSDRLISIIKVCCFKQGWKLPVLNKLTVAV